MKRYTIVFLTLIFSMFITSCGCENKNKEVTDTNNKEVESVFIEIPNSGINSYEMGANGEDVISILVNKPFSFNVDYLPKEHKATDLTWTVSDNTIVSVTNDGKVTGLKEGKCTIFATTKEGIKSNSIEVNVVTE